MFSDVFISNIHKNHTLYNSTACRTPMSRLHVISSQSSCIEAPLEEKNDVTNETAFGYGCKIPQTDCTFSSMCAILGHPRPSYNKGAALLRGIRPPHYANENQEGVNKRKDPHWNGIIHTYRSLQIFDKRSEFRNLAP